MVKRFLPIGLILTALAVFFIFDFGQYLTFETLSEQRFELSAQVEAHFVLSSLMYISIYILAVAFSLPISLIMTLSGGFLFGVVWGSAMAVTGATLGATILFLVAKTSVGNFLLAKAGSRLLKLKAGFDKDAWSYMFILRLVPIFPFFLVNLAPAFLGIPLRIFVVSTFFGMIPGTIVYSLAGSGMGQVFDQGKQFSPASIMSPTMLAALIGLALLTILPIIYKRFSNNNTNQ